MGLTYFINVGPIYYSVPLFLIIQTKLIYLDYINKGVKNRNRPAI